MAYTTDALLAEIWGKALDIPLLKALFHARATEKLKPPTAKDVKFTDIGAEQRILAQKSAAAATPTT